MAAKLSYIATLLLKVLIEDQHSDMFSRDELEFLMDKAVDFKELEHMPIHWLYRDMKKVHFDQIMNKGQITVCLKDENGDPESPINGRLQGINFQVNVDFETGNPMTPSIYGNRRIKIPVYDIYNMCPHLYFADFYCYGNSKHHLTLVMAEEGSNWDRFCHKRLPQLDVEDNPFLTIPDPYNRRNKGKSPMVLSNGIWVEVVVTENISLTGSEQAGKVKWSDRYRNIVPRDKDPDCPDCNID